MYRFQGDWEIKVKKEDLQNGDYYVFSPYIEEELKIKIEDDLSDEPDPTSNQINAIRQLLKNFNEIQKSFATLEESEIYIDQITILQAYKKGISYITIETIGSREPHYLIWENLIVRIYWIDKFNSLSRRIIEDGGEMPTKSEFKPIKYKPHPKYGKLKPSQQKANEDFVYNLVRYKHNELFKRLVHQGEIDIQNEQSLMSNACFMNNNEIVSFLIEKKAPINSALQWCSFWNNNKEALFLLLDNGADIDYQDDNGWTVLHIQASELAGYYKQKNNFLQSGWDTYDVDKKINDRKSTITKLIQYRAKTELTEQFDRNVMDIATNSVGVFKGEIINFFNDVNYKLKEPNNGNHKKN